MSNMAVQELVSKNARLRAELGRKTAENMKLQQKYDILANTLKVLANLPGSYTTAFERQQRDLAREALEGVKNV
jgi:hypothetical protein